MDSDDEMYDEQIDYDLDMAQKNWSRISNGINKESYSDGIQQGQNQTLQDGFDEGFKLGFATNVLLSKLKGILSGILEYHNLYDSSNIGEENANEAQIILDRADKIEALLLADSLNKLNIQTSNNVSCENCSCNKKNTTSESNIVPMNLNAEQFDDIISMDNFRVSLDENQGVNMAPVDPIKIENKIASSEKIKILLERCRKLFSNLGWNNVMKELVS